MMISLTTILVSLIVHHASERSRDCTVCRGYIFRGLCDLLLQFKDLIVVLEFKFADKSSQVEKMMAEGIQQTIESRCANGYASSGLKVITAVLVADYEKRQTII